MTGVDQIETNIYFHSINNLPTLGRGFDIDLSFKNASGIFVLSEKKIGFLTQYKLEIKNPSLINLTGQDDDKALTDLLFAFNIALSKTCISRIASNKHAFTPTYKPGQAHIEVEKKNGMTTVTVSDTMTLRDSVYIIIGYKEQIDEQVAMKYFNKVKKLNRYEISSNTPKREINLSKALRSYESAMDSIDEVNTFKNLYNSLEFSADWEGLGLRGVNLDKEIVNLSGISKLDTTEWRRFYNRTKHVDTTPTQINKYLKGIEKLPNIRIALRKTCNFVIMDRLSQL